jgi:molybdopterin-guanine dinucleotide biosynthesis protein A
MRAGGLKKCQIAAGVLAGGRAERFGGRPKGLLEAAPGICIIEKQVAELASSGLEQVVILANDPLPYRGFGPSIVPDLRAGMGPLGGIETAVSFYANRFHATLFLPCDLPAITERQIRILKESFVKARAGVAVAVAKGTRRQPLCAVVDNDLLPAISQAIDEGKRKVGEVWRDLGALFVHFPEAEPFFNVNAPGDWACWLTAKGWGNRDRYAAGIHREARWPCEQGPPQMNKGGPLAQNQGSQQVSGRRRDVRR